MDSVTTLCSLWRLALKNGETHLFTDHDASIEYDSEIYPPSNGVNAGLSESQGGFSIDTGEIQTHLDLPNLSAQAIREGALDGAEISHFRHDWMTGETTLLSKGCAGDVRIAGTRIEVEWLGQTSLLNRSTGRVFSRQCDAEFGDTRCGLKRDDFPLGSSCSRSFSACRDQFSNSVNFRGFPYLLGDDALQAGVRDSDRRDGGSRYA